MRPSDLVPWTHPDVEPTRVLAPAKRAEERFGGGLELAVALRSAATGGLEPALVDPGRISGSSERRYLP